ncbi:40S ribosomal protein S6-like protein [Cricetulus griseus]|nr:40S ribosomal protein S6-like protein [Cricetulus griseus]
MLRLKSNQKAVGYPYSSHAIIASIVNLAVKVSIVACRVHCCALKVPTLILVDISLQIHASFTVTGLGESATWGYIRLLLYDFGFKVEQIVLFLVSLTSNILKMTNPQKRPFLGLKRCSAVGHAKIKGNIFPDTNCQKLTEMDDECKLSTFYEKCMATGIAAEALNDEWKGYVVPVSGGNDKQGFSHEEKCLHP